MQHQKTDSCLLNREAIILGERISSPTLSCWCPLPTSYSFLNKKIILCLPGDGATTAEKSNGTVKIVEKALPLSLRQEFHFLGIYYQNILETASHRTYLMKKAGQLRDSLDIFQHTNNFNLNYYKIFFKTYLYPLIATRTGKRLSLKRAKENMRNLIMIGHCHGSIFAFQMERCFLDSMKKLGYSLAEQEEIQRQLVIFAFASRIPIGCSKSTVFHIISQADSQTETNWSSESFQGYLIQQYANKQKSALVFLNNHETIFSTKQLVFEKDTAQLSEKSYLSDWDHTLYAFIGHNNTVPQRSFSAKEHVRLIRCLMRTVISEKSKREFQDAFTRLPYQSLITMLLKNGKSILSAYERHKKICHIGRTTVFHLIKNGNVTKLKELIEHFQIPLDLHNQDGLFPIHAAIYKNNKEMVDLICQHTDRWYNLVSSKEETPIIYALLYRRFNIALHLWNVLSYKKSASDINAFQKAKRKILLFTIQNMTKYPALQYFFKKITQNEFPIEKEDTFFLLKQAEFLKQQKTAPENQLGQFITTKVYLFLNKLSPKLFFDDVCGKQISLATALCHQKKDKSLYRLVKIKKMALEKHLSNDKE